MSTCCLCSSISRTWESLSTSACPKSPTSNVGRNTRMVTWSLVSRSTETASKWFNGCMSTSFTFNHALDIQQENYIKIFFAIFYVISVLFLFKLKFSKQITTIKFIIIFVVCNFLLCFFPSYAQIDL